LAMGKDGYDCLAECHVLLDEETGPILRVCVENHFESVKILRGEKAQKRSKHRQPLLSRRSASLRSSFPSVTTRVAASDHCEGSGNTAGTDDSTIGTGKSPRESLHRAKSLGGSAMKKRLVKQKTVEELEKEFAHLSPTTDGRIVVVDGPEIIENLEDLRTIWEVKNNPTPLSDLTELEGDVGGWGDEDGGGDAVGVA